MKIYPATHLTKAFLLILTLLSIGCGGGGSSDGGSAGTDITGIYSVTITESGIPWTYIGLLSEGKLFFMADDLLDGVVGNYSTSGNSVSATSSIYLLLCSLYSCVDDGYMDSANFTGTVSSNQTVSGSFSTSAGASGSFSMVYEPITDRTPSLSLLSGNWSGVDGSDWVQFAINSSGGISGSDSDGCTFTGNAVIPYPAKNIYKINVSALCPGTSSTFTGYAALSDYLSNNDSLVLAGSGGITNLGFLMLDRN